MKVTFLGATSTVTGSRTLIERGQSKVLIDCGLFQGLKSLRLKNRAPFSVAPEEINAVFLTHAHLDHSGYLPLLVKNGFKGPIYCTHATKDLCKVLLPDSGHLQEEEAHYAEKRGYSKHHPPLPLYTRKDAERSLQSLAAVDWNKKIPVGDDSSHLEFEFFPAGHLFGAASILVTNGDRRILFSGDLGRVDDPLTRPPAFGASADDVVIESTYGNRNHPLAHPREALREIILRTYARGGVLLIPSFAVGRAQLVLYYLRELLDAGEIPAQPVYLNSPMAVKANQLYVAHAEGESKLTREHLMRICSTAEIVSTVDDSIRLNERKGPMIIIAASGMATGGRVLHHLRAFAGDPNNTVLFVGFQAAGTRGETVLNGAREVKIHGEYWPIRAEITNLDSMSAHADSQGLIEWASKIQPRPRRFFITHGEPAAADALRRKLEEKLGTKVVLPDYGEVFNLDDPIQVLGKGKA